MSRVIKLAIRGHLEGKLIHFNLTFTMNIGSHIQWGGGVLVHTHSCIICSWDHGLQEVLGLGAARIHPDKLGDHEYHVDKASG